MASDSNQNGSRGGGADPARVAVLSLRHAEKTVSRAGGYRFEDVIASDLDDAILLASTAAERPEVTAIDQGDTVRLELEGNNGTTEYVIIPDTDDDLVEGGSYDADILIA